jgi:hypothetical protein
MVDRTHRHLDAPVGHRFSLALCVGAEIVGVAIIGRPVARGFDPDVVVEVTRVAVAEGVPSGCSQLYGAAAREAKKRGFKRIVTYTRADEPGTSLRAAGWERVAETPGGEWSCPSRPRKAAVQPIPKVRWERAL